MSTTTEMRTVSSTLPLVDMSSSGYGSLKISSPSISSMSDDTDSQEANAAPGPSVGSTTSTLRSLYPRAARALVQRDFPLTHSLVGAAFALLSPPSSRSSVPDELDMHRRKWEILRITLETSVYISPAPVPSGGKNEMKTSLEALPSSLRANQLLSAPGFIATLHTRSVRLFSPYTLSQGPSAAFLPAQILVSLILASLKLECPEVGRSMIEDWLAQKDTAYQNHAESDKDGYKRVVELFCLHILPKLHDWEYAQEFLEYEQELEPETRSEFKGRLSSLRMEEINSARRIPSPPLDSFIKSHSDFSRAPSPAPSESSSSSVDTNDTHSTRTVVPRTRSRPAINGFTSISTSSTPKTESTSRSVTPDRAGSPSIAKNEKRLMSPITSIRKRSSSTSTMTTRSNPTHQRALTPETSLSTLKLIKTALHSYFVRLGPSRLVFVLLCIVVPLFSFLMRLHRKRRRAFISSTGTGTDVEAVRRRLAGRSIQSSLLGSIWSEVVRAVVDAVRMAGSGLV